jgi:Lrp/AsnC family transcriptional regulator
MSWNLDAIDLQILSIVQPDGRRSLTHIARSVKRSEATCFKRLQRLKETGVIRSTVTLLDPNAINVPTTAIVTMKIGTLEMPIESMAARLAEIPEVMDVFFVPNRHELLLRVVMSRTAGWPSLEQKLKSHVPAAEIDVSIVKCMQSKTSLPLGFAVMSA